MIGRQFNKLTIISFSHYDKRNRKHFLCRCECGKEKAIQISLLKSGNTKSCGCLAKESARSRSLGHGIASMKQVYAGYRSKAKKAGISFDLTIPQFKQIASSPCFYCGAVETNVHKSPHGTGDYAYNGIDKIDPSKGYTLNNIVPCCKKCNFSKSNMSQGEFIRWIKTAYEYLKQNAMANQWG